MTHLTQVTVNFATAARQRLRDCYDWHQAVWKAFPGREAEPRAFLTRLDQRRDPESWKTKPIPATYFTRSRYAFQLCANPTKKVSKELPDGSLTKTAGASRYGSAKNLWNGSSAREIGAASPWMKLRSAHFPVAVSILRRMASPACTAPWSLRAC